MRSIFIEDVENPVVTNTMFRLAKLIMRAESIDSVVVTGQNTGEFRSSSVANKYFTSVRRSRHQKPSLMMCLSSFIIAMVFALFFPLKSSIIERQFKGLTIGPSIYDAYLAKFKTPTYKNGDLQIIRVYYNFILNLKFFLNVFKEEDVACVLTSHRVGLRGSSLSLAASHMGIPIYSFGGDNNIALIKSHHAFSYEYAPLESDLKKLREIKQDVLEGLFSKTYRDFLNHKIIMDSRFAYSGTVWTNRMDFARHYPSVEIDKPFVFILPHVYTDYPNTLFRNSQYSDYYEWFADTLKLISQNTQINWIIREHPSSRFYGLGENQIETLRGQYSRKNIIWISAEESFSSASIGNLADAVITYIGSAGFEYPAMYGVPSIYWSHAPYAKFKIGTQIQDKREYEELLEGFPERIPWLTLDRLEAKRHFIFTNYLSRVPYPIGPQMTQADYLSAEQNPDEYIDRAIAFYDSKYHDLIDVEVGILKQLESDNFEGIRHVISS